MQFVARNQIFISDPSNAANALKPNSDGSLNVVTASPLVTSIPAHAGTLSILPINFNGSGDNIVIPAGIGLQTIKVYGLYFSVAAPTAITFKDGVITDAAVTYAAGGGLTLPFHNGEPYFVGAAASNFIMGNSNSVQVSGRIYYLIS